MLYFSLLNSTGIFTLSLFHNFVISFFFTLTLISFLLFLFFFVISSFYRRNFSPSFNKTQKLQFSTFCLLKCSFLEYAQCIRSVVKVLIALLIKHCDWTKYLINIHKHNYQSSNTSAIIFVLIFFHRVIIILTL